MKKRRLGSSNLFVSEISFGCMSLDVKSEESEKIIHQAFEAGINFFDTADLYDKGENEKMLGLALKPIRDHVIIATKVGNQLQEDGSGWDWNPTKAYIIKAVENSLLRLQTDYIDLYQLHGGTINDPIDETIEAFELLKQQGKIRAYGISSIRPDVIREWIKRSNMASVMMQYSLLDRRPEEESFDLLAHNNISVITRGTLAKGLLVDKEAKDYLGYSKSEVQQLQTELQSKKYPISAPVQFVLKQSVVSSAILGFRTSKQLQTILESQNEQKEILNFDALRSVLKPIFYKKHS